MCKTCRFVSLNFDHTVVARNQDGSFFVQKIQFLSHFNFQPKNTLSTPINNSINSNSQKKVSKTQNQIGLDLFSLA